MTEHSRTDKVKTFMKSRTFLVQTGLILVSVIFLLVIIYNLLASYTHHGETITVPDLKGMSRDVLEKFLSDKNLAYKVMDSSMYDPQQPAGVVLDQDPAANEKVKQDRTIYITINSNTPTLVKMPDLTDVSHRQAEAILETFGLKVGEVTFKPDLAKNAVLSQMFKGKEIKEGTMIAKGSVIDLVLGDGLGNTKVFIPELTGLTLEEALFVIKGSSLNQGQIITENGDKPDPFMIVQRQDPAADDSTMIMQGDIIDLYVGFPEKPKRK